MAELQRITTRFVDNEDRIRLAGEDGTGQALVLWLTQRLVNRLRPHLCAWLERRASPSSQADGAHTEVLQNFAQQAALAALEPLAPVSSHAPSIAWLVHSVDVTSAEHVLILTFKDAVGAGNSRESATLTLSELALRQWLSILHSQYAAAEWSLTQWPEWVAQASSTPMRAALLH